MKRILCYGDSNTWGYISGTDHQRYGENERWTRVLKNLLGGGYEIIEEGLNSRTLQSEDLRAGKEGRNGLAFLKPCMDTHDRFDVIVHMLATNELKIDYGHTPEDILNLYVKHVEVIKNFRSVIDGSTPILIVSGTPIVREETSYLNGRYKGGTEKSMKVNALIREYCAKQGITYVNNDDLQVGPDGVHLTKESHLILGKRMADLIKTKI